jgi:dolichyl-phosphate-mannose--protein O-mannosyl transferase
VIGTILVCIIFFLVIPAVIYIASYIPYVTPDGELTIEALLKEMWENQVFMLTYHQGASEYHPYSSRWYQWIFDIRPILYFRESDNYPGWKSSFAAFNNPLISWAGIGCIVITAIEGFRRKCGRALFIFLSYLSQLLPWVFISRTIFAYHYFPSIMFCVVAISYAMNFMLARRKEGAAFAVYGLTAAAVALYAAFYPILVGIYVPTWYTTNFLRWFPSWPF